MVYPNCWGGTLIWHSLFSRRRLGVQAGKKPGRPRRFSIPRLAAIRPALCSCARHPPGACRAAAAARRPPGARRVATAGRHLAVVAPAHADAAAWHQAPASSAPEPRRARPLAVCPRRWRRQGWAAAEVEEGGGSG